MRFFRQFQHLLPFSEAWRTTLEKQLRQFFEGLAAGTQEPAVEFVDDAYLQLFPQTTDQLAEWETQFFGLPQDNAEQDRRDFLEARWKAQGGQSPRYIQDVLRAAGFDVYVHEWWNAGPFFSLFYALESGSVAAEDTFPLGLWFSTAGDFAFITGFNSQNVYGYPLSTAWDVSTLGASVLKDVSPEDTQPHAVAFDPTGTSMFVLGNQNGAVFQYTLVTPWIVSTASYASKSLSVVAEDNLPRGMTFNDDGTLLIVVGQQNNKLYAYDLSTAYDVSTASFNSDELDLSAASTGMTGCAFSSGGQYVETISAASDSVWQWKLATPYDISTAGAPVDIGSVAAQETIPQDMFVRQSNGDTYAIGSAADSIFRYDRNESDYEDPNKVFFLGASGGTQQNGLHIRQDGTQYFTAAATQDEVQTWDMSTPFDVTTSTAGAQFSIVAQEPNVRGVHFSPDGFKFFIVGLSNFVYQYEMTVAWDVSTASYSNKSFDVSNEEINSQDLTFSDDGSLMFVIGIAADAVFQYSMTTRFDVSTAVYDNVSLDITPQDSGPSGISFADRGFSLWVAGDANDALHKYDLPAQYDIANAVFDSSIIVGGFASNPKAVAFGECADKNLYFIDRNLGFIYQYWRLQPKDPRDYTSNPLIGTTQCGDDGSAPDTPIAECGEQPPNQQSTLSAACNAFLVNDVGYLVNENLTPQAPPSVPDDSAKWPYFLYIGGQTFPTVANIPEDRRGDFEDLILRIAPAQQWIVTLVNYTVPTSGSFAYSFAFDLPS